MRRHQGLLPRPTWYRRHRRASMPTTAREDRAAVAGARDGGPTWRASTTRALPARPLDLTNADGTFGVQLRARSPTAARERSRAADRVHSAPSTGSIAKLAGRRAGRQPGGCGWSTACRKLVMPMTNARGVNDRRRDELLPTGDPYDQSPSACMNVTGRSVNGRPRASSTSRSFHGGMQAIGINWGCSTTTRARRTSPHHSPDDNSQRGIAAQMRLRGHGHVGGNYNTARAVRLGLPSGGMEDWGYAASWTAERVAHPPRSAATRVQDGTPTGRRRSVLVETTRSAAGGHVRHHAASTARWAKAMPRTCASR